MSKNMCVSHHLVFLLLFDSSFSTVAQTNKVPLSAHTACSGLHTRYYYGYYSVMTHSAIPRAITAEAILANLNCFSPSNIEKDTRACLLENII